MAVSVGAGGWCGCGAGGGLAGAGGVCALDWAWRAFACSLSLRGVAVTTCRGVAVELYDSSDIEYRISEIEVLSQYQSIER